MVVCDKCKYTLEIMPMCQELTVNGWYRTVEDDTCPKCFKGTLSQAKKCSHCEEYAPEEEIEEYEGLCENCADKALVRFKNMVSTFEKTEIAFLKEHFNGRFIDD